VTDSWQKCYEPHSGRWLPPDEWLEATLAEARRRHGFRFTLANVWRRIRGQSTEIDGRELAAAAYMHHAWMTS
jgi:hypothetical protein